MTPEELKKRNNEKSERWRLANIDRAREQSRKCHQKRRSIFEKYGGCYYCGREVQALPNVYRCINCYMKKTARAYKKYGPLNWQDLLNLFNRQNGKCIYSGINLILGVNAAIDHIIPKSKGGTNEIKNLQWIHEGLNDCKGTRSEQEFLDLIKQTYVYQQNKSSL